MRRPERGIAAAAFAIDTRSGERVELNGELSDIAFIAARDAEVSAQSTDDILIAARTVRLDRAQGDHLIVAGGDIQATNIIAEDVFTMGSQVRLQSGRSNDDLVAAGCRIEISPEFSVDGAAMLAAGEIDIEGAIGGGLRAVGNEIRINGTVTGDVEVEAEKLTLGPRAHIMGDFTYRADRVSIAPEAVVTGTRTALPAPASEQEHEDLGLGAAIAFAATAIITLILGVGLLVLVVVALFPALMNNAARAMADTPLKTLGAGFVFMALAPVLIGFLFLTILGIPLAIVIGAIYLAIAPLAFAATVYFLALRARLLLKRSAAAEPSKASGATRLVDVGDGGVAVGWPHPAHWRRGLADRLCDWIGRHRAAGASSARYRVPARHTSIRQLAAAIV